MEHIIDPDWCSPAEAARITGFSERSIQRFVKEGRLQAIRLSPRRTRIKGLSLRRFLAGTPVT